MNKEDYLKLKSLLSLHKHYNDSLIILQNENYSNVKNVKQLKKSIEDLDRSINIIHNRLTN